MATNGTLHRRFGEDDDAVDAGDAHSSAEGQAGGDERSLLALSLAGRVIDRFLRLREVCFVAFSHAGRRSRRRRSRSSRRTSRCWWRRWRCLLFELRRTETQEFHNAGAVAFSLDASLTNTVGTIKRCGRLRIELVVLLATLLNVAVTSVGTFVRERDVTATVMVGKERECELVADGGVSVEQRAAQRVRAVRDGGD